MKIGLKVTLWLVSAATFLMLLLMPISSSAQIVAGGVAVALAIALKMLRPTGHLRLIALAIATSVVLRYIFWRATETLPPISDLSSFLPGIMLFGAELFAVCMLALSLFVVANPRRDRLTPAIPDDEAPTVDVFIPSYNEPAELLEQTLTAALRMDYPADCFNVFLLDDGATDQKCQSSDSEVSAEALVRKAEMSAMCGRLGVKYLTRERNEHAKAGNLNNGLAHSTGDLVAVFDADHIPAPDFLRETVGHFLEEEDLFLVQTPHFFSNPDPIERNLGVNGKMPSESEMFYGMVQRGLDHWNASFFCGSAAVLRRAALEQTDGFAGRSITEDCETALALHSQGWKSRYVSKPMISGLQPETFSSFIGQRSRWASGMTQILMLERPLFKGGLTLAQRFCYSSSIMFWLFPFARLAFLIAPLFYLLFNMQIFVASGSDFLAYTVTYMAASLVIQNLLYGGLRRPWVSEIYEFVQSFHLGAAVVSTIFSPSKPTFRVTAKDEISDRAKLSEMAGLFYVVFAALAALQTYGIYRIVTEPENFWLLAIVNLWNFLNLLLAMCSIGAVNERPSGVPQAVIKQKAMLVPDGEEAAAVPVIVTSGSPKELKLRLGRGVAPLALKRGSAAILRLPNGDEITAALKGAASEELTLVVPAGNAAGMTSLLYAKPAQWRSYDLARRPTGVLVGTADFIALAFSQVARGLLGPVGSSSAKPVQATTRARQHPIMSQPQDRMILRQNTEVA